MITSSKLDKLFKKRKGMFYQVVKSFKLYTEKFGNTENSFENFVSKNFIFILKKVAIGFTNFLCKDRVLEGIQDNLFLIFSDIFYPCIDQNATYLKKL